MTLDRVLAVAGLLVGLIAIPISVFIARRGLLPGRFSLLPVFRSVGGLILTCLAALTGCLALAFAGRAMLPGGSFLLHAGRASFVLFALGSASCLP